MSDSIRVLVPIMDERTHLITGYEYKAFPRDVGLAILRTTKEIEDNILSGLAYDERKDDEE